MRRVLKCGDVEHSNNLSEQMMRRIKMSQKNAGNIGSERSARHNAFMYLVIESCKMMKKNVEDYLKVMLERLRKTKGRLPDVFPAMLSGFIAENQKNINYYWRKPLKISDKETMHKKWTHTDLTVKQIRDVFNSNQKNKGL